MINSEALAVWRQLYHNGGGPAYPSPQEIQAIHHDIARRKQILVGASPGELQFAFGWVDTFCPGHSRVFDPDFVPALWRSRPPVTTPTPIVGRPAAPAPPTPAEIAAKKEREAAAKRAEMAKAAKAASEKARKQFMEDVERANRQPVPVPASEVKASAVDDDENHNGKIRVVLSPEEKQECASLVETLQAVAQELATAGQSEGARQALATAKDLAKFVAVEGLIIFVPSVGLVASGMELITGKDLLTGESLTPFQRALAGVNILSFGLLRGFQSASRIVAKLATRPGRVGTWARAMVMRFKAADQAVASKAVVGAGKAADAHIAQRMNVAPRTEWAIENVESVWRGTDIPRKFDLTVNGTRIRVKPNASEHIYHYERKRLHLPGGGAGPYSSLAAAAEEGLKTATTAVGRHLRRVEEWSLVFERMEDGALELLHALFRGNK